MTTGLGMCPAGMCPLRISGSILIREAALGVSVMSGWMVGSGVASEVLDDGPSCNTVTVTAVVWINS